MQTEKIFTFYEKSIILTAMRKILIASIFGLTFCVFAFGQTEKNSNCPTISMIGPASVVMPDGDMDFTASISGIDTSNVGYKWTVTKGAIVQGQGTNKILVNIKGLYDDAITATVEFLNLPEGCENSVSETGIMTVHFKPRLLNEFDFASKIENKSLDEITAELKEKPDSTLYIITDPGEKTAVKKVKTMQNQIIKYLSESEISADRIVNLEGKKSLDRIRFWLVMPGSEPPTP